MLHGISGMVEIKEMVTRYIIHETCLPAGSVILEMIELCSIRR